MVQFSVVIPLYNKAQSVLQTLQCIERQTYSQYEVVIVNDGSTDGSEQVVRAWIDSKQDSRWTLLTKTNGGVSSARNYGVQNAKYEYIAFLDADDYWESAYLETQAKMIEDFPRAAMWSVGWGYLEGDKKVSVSHRPANHRGYILNYWTQQKGTNIFCVCVCVCRREALEAVGGYDIRMKYGEDLDVAYRMILNYPVAFYNKTLGYYRQDAENRACAIPHIRWEERLECYIEKYKTYRKKNTDFCRFIDKGTANMAAQYLFEENNHNVIPVVQQLNFSAMPFYYSLYFQTPFWMGKMCYKCMKVLKRMYAGVIKLTNKKSN